MLTLTATTLEHYLAGEAPCPVCGAHTRPAPIVMPRPAGQERTARAWCGVCPREVLFTLA